VLLVRLDPELNRHLFILCLQYYIYSFKLTVYEQLPSNGNNKTIRQWSTDSKYFLGLFKQQQQKTEKHFQLYSYFFVFIYCYYIFLTTINYNNFFLCFFKILN